MAVDVVRMQGPGSEARTRGGVHDRPREMPGTFDDFVKGRVMGRTVVKVPIRAAAPPRRRTPVLL